MSHLRCEPGNIKISLIIIVKNNRYLPDFGLGLSCESELNCETFGARNFGGGVMVSASSMTISKLFEGRPSFSA